MAQVLQAQHNLVTLRCAWRPGPGGGEVIIRLMDGREPVAEMALPAAEFGLQETLSPKAYRSADLRLPDMLEKMLHEAVARIAPDMPLWIHIARGAGALAILPWELLLRRYSILENTAILRVPNFLADPFTIGTHTEMVVCISSPRAKMPFPAVEYAHRMVHDVSQMASRPVTLHVFADLDAFQDLAGLSGSGLCDVVVHDPSRMSFDGTVRIDRNLSVHDHRITNPWMLWIAETLHGRPVDAVHFICPGYFHDTRGSLALAETPVKNRDSAWSRFVAAEEIHALLDSVGAHTVGFTAPHIDVWAMGLRLLAFHLSWVRPGPIIMHDGGAQTFDDVARNYACLFDWVPGPVPPLSTEFYCHPRLVNSGEREDLAVESILKVSEDMLALAEVPVAHPAESILDVSALGSRPSLQSGESWVELATRHFDLQEASLSAIEQDSGVSPSEKQARLEAIRFMRHALATSTGTAAPLVASAPTADSAEGEL